MEFSQCSHQKYLCVMYYICERLMEMRTKYICVYIAHAARQVTHARTSVESHACATNWAAPRDEEN